MTTPSTSSRRDAALRDLNPLPQAAPDSSDQEQEIAWLLAVATAHPRTEKPRRSGALSAGRRRAGRGAVALGIVLTGLAGGGVAVAASGGWDQIASSWSAMTGHDPQHKAEAPRLVASGTGSSSQAGPTGTTDLQLLAAPTADGGQCTSIRSVGFSLDNCRAGQDGSPIALAGLRGDAFYHVHYSPTADYLWGRVDPQEVAQIRLSAADRVAVATTVDRNTGYWVTSIIDTTSTSRLTLTASDPSGRVLLSQTVAR